MDFTDLPIGFSLNLAENEVALNAYNSLAEAQKMAVIAKARDAKTVEEMHRIISCLAEGWVV